MYSSTITEYEDKEDNRKLVQPVTENSTMLNPPPDHIPALQPLIWRNIISIAVLHVAGLYLFITLVNKVKFWTWIFGMGFVKLSIFTVSIFCTLVGKFFLYFTFAMKE